MEMRMFRRVMMLMAILAAPLFSQVKFDELRGVGLVVHSGYVGQGNTIVGVSAGYPWGDIDGDGDLDACAGPNMFMHKDRSWSLLSILLNDGSGTMTEVSHSYSARTTKMPNVPGGGTSLLLDLDGDGDLDQAIAMHSVSKTSGQDNAWLLKNDGKGHFTDATKDLHMPPLLTAFAAPIQANKDKASDLIYVAWGDPSVLLLNDGKGVFQPSKTTGWKSYNGKAVLVGDFDQDGDEDVVFVVFDQKIPNPYYLNDGKGHFSLATKKKWPLPAEPGQCGAVGDLDGDGDLDLVFGQYRGDLSNRPDRILWNDGKGDFTMTTLPGIKAPGKTGRFYTTYSMALGDVDEDGDLDLVVGYAGPILANTLTNTTRIYENLGNRQFREFAGAIYEPGWTHRLTLVDFDHDGDLDLLSTKAWFGTPLDHVWMNLTRQVHFRKPPQIGRTLLLDVYSARKQVATLDFVGLQRSKLVLPPMGNWWLNPSTMVSVGSSLFLQQSGKQTVELPIPWNTYLIGLELHAQSLYYDVARRTLRFSNLMHEKILP